MILSLFPFNVSLLGERRNEICRSWIRKNSELAESLGMQRPIMAFSNLPLALVAAVIVLVQHDIASAQLIGNRAVGAPLSSLSQQRVPGVPTAASQGAGQANAAGIGQASNAIGSLGNRMQIDNTRFVRGNRSRQDFVGSNRTDLSGFVGAGQALGVGRVP